MITITAATTISSVGSDEVGCFDCEDEDKPGEVLDACVGDAVGGDWVEVGWGVGIGVFRLGACGFGAVKKGV